MNFLIISHAGHKIKEGNIFSYAPYVREMNLWLKYVDKVEIVAPMLNENPSAIDLNYNHTSIKFNAIPAIHFKSFKSIIPTFFKFPYILYKLFFACKRADHIHLRCPGNIGLLGCFVQIFFPKKIKTAKYAGNWDPKAKQPIGYKIQKKILSNTFLTKNITVLVYGKWTKQTKNIKSFFTATFNELEKEPFIAPNYEQHLNFMFVGGLVKGKRPLLTIKIVEGLLKEGKSITLDIYGDGILKEGLENYVINNNIAAHVIFHGNQSKETVKAALKKAHFLMLPSKSEGWPKAVAEAMFYGVIPIATEVSCVPFMLDYGKRGVLIFPILKEAIETIVKKISNKEELLKMSKAALDWSQKYTLETFESEISKFLK